jgi:hypothetical protein
METHIPRTLATLILSLLVGLQTAAGAGAAQRADCTTLTLATGNTICFSQAATTPTRSQ